MYMTFRVFESSFANELIISFDCFFKLLFALTLCIVLQDAENVFFFFFF